MSTPIEITATQKIRVLAISALVFTIIFKSCIGYQAQIWL